MRVETISGLIVVILLLPAWSFGQQHERGSPTPLKQLVEQVSKESPDVLVAEQRWETTRFASKQASALPETELMVQHVSVGSPRPFAGYSNSDFAYIGFGASQEFPFPGKRALRGLVAERQSNVVRRQAEVGIDVVSDGEFGKSGFAAYINERLGGFERRPGNPGESGVSRGKDRRDFADFYREYDGLTQSHRPASVKWVCTGPITYDPTLLQIDIANFKAALASADGAEVSRALEETGAYTVMAGDEPIVLDAADLEVRAEEHEEFALAQDGPYAVALDLHVDDELRLEGLARELARAVNDHRKASGLAIADRIKVRLWADGPVAEAAERHGAWIAGEVLAVGWQVNPDTNPEGAALDVEGAPVTVALEVADAAAA